MEGDFIKKECCGETFGHKPGCVNYSVRGAEHEAAEDRAYSKGRHDGIVEACALVDDMYGNSNTHLWRQGDSVLAKLNIIKKSQMKTNPLRSIQPYWARHLTMQQQSVLFLAGRGGDGIPKHHPTKGVQRAYRGTVLLAAKYGRALKWGEGADSFMSLDRFGDDGDWAVDIVKFFDHVDELPHHFYMHLMHGTEILGYKHPEKRFRDRWYDFYIRCAYDLHLTPETEQEMDDRLCDWYREFWEDK